MLFLLSICCITSWTINIVLLYIQGKQVLCNWQKEQNIDGVLQPCGEGLDERTHELTSPGSIHMHWWSFALVWVSSTRDWRMSRRVTDTLNKGEICRNGSGRKNREWEEEAIERRAAEKEQQSLCLFVRPSSRDKKRFSAEALHLSLSLLFSSSLSLLSPEAPRMLPPQKYSPIKWII